MSSSSAREARIGCGAYSGPSLQPGMRPASASHDSATWSSSTTELPPKPSRMPSQSDCPPFSHQRREGCSKSIASLTMLLPGERRHDLLGERPERLLVVTLDHHVVDPERLPALLERVADLARG